MCQKLIHHVYTKFRAIIVLNFILLNINNVLIAQVNSSIFYHRQKYIHGEMHQRFDFFQIFILNIW